MSAKDTSVPLYEQIKRSLREDIKKGVLAPGQLLPGQRELAERHNVSDITVRRALQDLAREKLVNRIVGVGTFVRAEIEPARIALLLPRFDDFNLWRDRGKDFQPLLYYLHANAITRNYCQFNVASHGIKGSGIGQESKKRDVAPWCHTAPSCWLFPYAFPVLK